MKLNVTSHLGAHYPHISRNDCGLFFIRMLGYNSWTKGGSYDLGLCFVFFYPCVGTLLELRSW